ncbi:hypothetical protein C0989_005142 [Termitomyces sp. Mn162]|nr:hypothetical protein C0989_005142 [Termitomyces sp. Mn162]
MPIKLVLAEAFQDNAHDLAMLLQGFGVDEDIVKIHANNTFHNQIMEDVIHHSLEGGQAVGETKEHHQRFKESMIDL